MRSADDGRRQYDVRALGGPTVLDSGHLSDHRTTKIGVPQITASLDCPTSALVFAMGFKGFKTTKPSTFTAEFPWCGWLYGCQSTILLSLAPVSVTRLL
jgi:hypothetical protein